MRAAVTERIGSMTVVERPEPDDPAPGVVVVAPEAVGICGSDYSFFTGHMTAAAGGSQFPRVQGHEVGGRIAALGDGCGARLRIGQRVALMPLHACGRCYPCSVGRSNTCDDFQLIGIHVDGGLQGLMSLPHEQVHPIEVDDGALAAMAEPVSVAVRAVRRARIEPGEHVVVLGAGPIGQCVAIVARELGAQVMLVDLQSSRLELGREIGCEGVAWESADAAVEAAREWA
ncbi:MAG: alcohol dehydrogenase catalytic domain-containing protein, partial [Solirubrobacteraceae bacterium]